MIFLLDSVSCRFHVSFQEGIRWKVEPFYVYRAILIQDFSATKIQQITEPQNIQKLMLTSHHTWCQMMPNIFHVCGCLAYLSLHASLR